MAMPTFQELMLPLLRLAEDGREHKVREAIVSLAKALDLSSAELDELLPSGQQSRFANRLAWARSYLKAAGLLETPARGSFRITDRGRAVLSDAPPSIDMKFLERFPEYQEFRTRKTSDDTSPVTSETGGTPQELLESGYSALRESLAGELLARVRSVTPGFFEKLVVDLLVSMGYGGSRQDAGAAIGRSGDEGIDGIIKEDRLGLDIVCVQAKRWATSVGRPEVQAFAGSLEGQRARKGVFITTSTFTRDAREYVKTIEKRIVLIDGVELADLMIDHGVGVGDLAIYTVKHIDEDYFESDDTVAPTLVQEVAG